MKVYIAGAVHEHPSPEMIRQEIKDQTDEYITWIDPLDYEPSDDPEGLIDIDIGLVEECDKILVYWVPEFSSWGTASELYHASRIEHMPAVVWQVGKLGPQMDSRPDWLLGLTDEIVTSLDEAIFELRPVNTCPHCQTEYDKTVREYCPNEVDPSVGGCWVCHHESDDMEFDMEFDTFYHEDCLPTGVDDILEYERRGI